MIQTEYRVLYCYCYTRNIRVESWL